MDQLIDRTEGLKDRLHHFGKSDPNLYIYENYLNNGLSEKAEKFLAYRQLWEKTMSGQLIPDHPLHICFSFQNSCNLKCPHCYRQYNNTPSKRGALALEEIYDLIDQCKELGVPSVHLGAGIEVFLYQHIEKAIRYIGEKEFEDFWIISNGEFMDKDRVDLLLESNVTRLAVSMDAVTPETYSKVRGGDFDRVVENIFYFLKQRDKKKVKLPVMRVSFIDYYLNQHEKQGFIDFWKPHVNEIDIQSLASVKAVNTLPYETMKEEDIRCTYPSAQLWIDWNGEYRPCCSDFSKHLITTNFRETSIKEAWESQSMSDLRSQLKCEKKLNKACVNCLLSGNSQETFKPLN